MHIDAIGHGGGVACAVLAFEAVNAELIALLANILSLQIHLEALDVVIGSFLPEVEKHARLGPVLPIFGVVAVSILSFLRLDLVATLGRVLSQDLVDRKAS